MFTIISNILIGISAIMYLYIAFLFIHRLIMMFVDIYENTDKLFKYKKRLKIKYIGGLRR